MFQVPLVNAAPEPVPPIRLSVPRPVSNKTPSVNADVVTFRVPTLRVPTFVILFESTSKLPVTVALPLPSLVGVNIPDTALTDACVVFKSELRPIRNEDVSLNPFS